MDTWWKKLIYSSWLKAVAVLGFCLVGFLLFFSFVNFQFIPREDNIYESYYFNDAFVEKAGYVRDYIVRYRNSEIIDNITVEDIKKYQEANGGTLTEEEARKQIIEDREDYLRLLDNELGKSNVNVDFYAKSRSDGAVITNMNTALGEEQIIKELKGREVYLIGNGHYIYDRSNALMNSPESQVAFYDNDLRAYYDTNVSSITHDSYYRGESFEGEEQFDIYVALKQPLEVGDKFYTYEQNFLHSEQLKELTYEMIIFASVLGVLLGIYWLIVVGKTSKEKGVSLNAFDKIPVELQLVILGISTMLFLQLIDEINYSFDLSSALPYIGTRTVPKSLAIAVMVFGVISCYVGIGLAIASSFIKHIKNKSLKQYIGIIRVIKLLKDYLMTERMLVVATVVIAGINIGAFIISFLMACAFESIVVFVILIITWSIILVLILAKVALDYKRILQGTKNIARGNLEHKIQLEKSLPVLVDLADTVNTIGTGLHKAVAQSVKSERLKAELITNVSHDLKTPLTSIISYIDLLKGEEINNEVAKEYIGILDERSSRLKQLVEDLVEASKAVTGNVEAKLAPFRLDELVLQAVGEYTDRLEAKGLQLVITQVQVAEVMGDSRHVWRIVENLLSNVSKYAMPHTRAYMEVLNQGDYGTFIIKNISKEALNIEPEELTERFVRGDVSRTTEGSGLGLAIAQSLIDLQAGQMTISIDGDLFKVEVKIPTVKNRVSLEK